MDPLNYVWNKIGKKYSLQKLQMSQSKAMLPYNGISGFSLKTPKQTLFRFPLRNEPSKVSKEIHTIETLRKLLEVLKAEAKYLLLFLRSVCSVEVIEITDSGSSTLFKVSLSSCDHEKKQKLSRKVELAYSVSCSDSEKEMIKEKFSLCVEIQENSNSLTRHRFVVVHRVGSNDPDVVALAQRLGDVPPWVSTAFEITNENYDENGRIFCFLPLPVEDKAPFTVHVNGTFAVSRNRRHLKWAAQERQRDSESIWNQLLVEKCFPNCYADLISEVANISAKNPEIVKPEKVYSCWPVLYIVSDTQWHGMLEELFQNVLYSNNAVHTSIGNWIKLTDAIMVDEPVPDSVGKALSNAKVNLVQLKPEQWAPIRLYIPKKHLNTVTPSFTRCILKKNIDAYRSMTQYDKCCILNYCLSDYDDNHDMPMDELLDLELLPLSNGTFSKFEQKKLSHSNRIIYICTKDIPHDLVPGQEHKMVDLLKNYRDLHKKLLMLANTKKTQLTALDEFVVASLLKQNPFEWNKVQVAKFWQWIQGIELDIFSDTNIVPVKTTNENVIFECPNKKSSLIYVSETAMYHKDLMSALGEFGIKFSFQSDFRFVRHDQLTKCVYQLKPQDVLDALPWEGIEDVTLTDNQSQAVAKFLLHIKHDKTINNEKICRMSIFSVVQVPKKHFSINQLKTQKNKAMVKSVDFLFETELLRCLPLIINETPSLFIHLSDHVTIVDNFQFVEEIVLPAVRKKSIYGNKMTDLMVSILKHIAIILDKHPKLKDSLIEKLSQLPFVTINHSSDEKRAPFELFDPNDQLLKQLFKGDPFFPISKFANHINELRLLRLKGPELVTTKELFQVLVSYNESHKHLLLQNGVYYCKMRALFRYLTQYTHHLQKRQVGSPEMLKTVIAEHTRKHPCLPISTNKPPNYPSQLSWKSDGHSETLTTFQSNSVVLLPNEINNGSHTIAPEISGSEVFFVENVPSEVCALLSSKNDDLAVAIVKHFKHVLESKSDIEPYFLENISLQTYSFLSNCKFNLIDLKSTAAWVLLETSKFVRPEVCAFETNSQLSVLLDPFVYILPRKLKQFESFLCYFGVQKSVSEKQITSTLADIRNNTNHDIDSDKAWIIVRSILNWIVNTGKTDFVLVPIESESSYPDLHPASEVSYSDNDLILRIAKSSDDNHKIVHHSISPDLVSQLRLTPLCDRLGISDDICYDTAGQTEPLITRLCNILEAYKDGINILKELIQNADDAGANEVNILYDARHHTTEDLVFKGMAGSHGPALVVHNDATFTKQDFKNITKLAGATKHDSNIGEFGIGFCSAYHITDIPSFVSGEWLYIFDPTVSCLKGVLKNGKLAAGKRSNYMHPFIVDTDQLAPYKNLFFDFNPHKPYNGTIFRFPFRRNRSQLSSTIYDKRMMDELSHQIRNEGANLLLFLNNVKKITYHLIQDGNQLPTQLLNIENIKYDENISRIRTTSYHPKKKMDDKYYLISNLSLNSCVAAVSCQLSCSNEKYKVEPVNGLTFCYLPLPSSFTGLPVHIHANFAVKNDRSAICTSTSLLQTVIADAYCNLLCKLKMLHQKQKLDDYAFYTFWPLESKLQIKTQWLNLLHQLYPKIIKKDLFYSSFVKKWEQLSQAKFLDESMLCSPSTSNDVSSIVKALGILELPIVHLPGIYMEELKKNHFDFSLMKLHEFVADFLNGLHLFSSHVNFRNDVLFELLKAFSNERINTKLSNLFKSYPCIPCMPDGVKLNKCSDIIDPKSKISKLFVASDSRFPIPMFIEDRNVRKSISKLGMLKVTLPWDILLDCAKQFGNIEEIDTIEKIDIIMECVRENIREKPNPKFSSDIEHLKITRFLPVLKKPDDYILPWKGKDCSICSPVEVVQVENIKKDPFLIGSQRIILNTGENGCKCFDTELLKFFSIQCIPKVEDVLKNYQILITSYDTKLHKTFEQTEKVVNLTYRFLNDKLHWQCDGVIDRIPSTNIGKQLSVFKCECFIWIQPDGEFIHPENVANDWIRKSRYLYKVPDDLAPLKFLKHALGLKETFAAAQLIDAFNKMMKESENGKIHCDCKHIVNRIIQNLSNCTKDDFDNLENKGDIHLPSEDYTLHPIDALLYNDAQWLKPNPSSIFIHSNFHRQTAIDLGVKPYRDKFLDTFTAEDNFESIEFGQREKLPERIRNILRDYPLDITLIKELLQNADDAKATKMYVILDKRQHGKDKVISDNWKDLQGPALLVWNDKEFSDIDLKGIQSLGVGSKRDDYDSIGNFGIGFNVVYHLTDCPCLFTRGSKLCVFDPRCHFVPTASELYPGRCYNVHDEFWNSLSDIKSTFLLNQSLQNIPEELGKGSMFRFPLRQTKSELFEKVITKEDMESYLDEWITEIKEALLFLNHICCFKVLVIDEKKSKIVTKISYEVDTNRDESYEKRNALDFSPFTVTYPLTIKCSHLISRQSASERWLIQQGYGDIHNVQTWPSIVEKLLPKHGLAVPLQSSVDNFVGKIFCFLPLPGSSGLPVHINGQFYLNSNRRSIWNGNDSDDKKKWNDRIIQAICSSYVQFILEARSYFIKVDGYSKRSDLVGDCKNYYSLFPYWIDESNESEVSLTRECKDLAKLFYKSLKPEYTILAREEYQDELYFVKWCSLVEKEDPFKQTYFPHRRYVPINILEKTGMKMTLAPLQLYDHLKEVFKPGPPLIATPNAVFHFYANFKKRIFKNGIPCHISKSPFQTIEEFGKFLKYVTKDKPKSEYREFVEPPFDHPFLLTADDFIRPFTIVLSSRFYNLFPRSHSLFLHSFCFDLKLDPKYFKFHSEKEFSNIEVLMESNFSVNLEKPIVAINVISDKDLKMLWKCISSETQFLHHQSKIVTKWALLPATNSYLYTNSEIVPVIRSENKWRELLGIFERIGVPILRHDVDEDLAERYCPKLDNDFDSVLSIIYKLQCRSALSQINADDADQILQYLGRCNFRSKKYLLDQVKSLPLYKTVTGDLTSLLDKDVYIQPSESFPIIAYDKWAPKDSVVFLEPNGSWTHLCESNSSLLCTRTTPEDVYVELIFKVFNTFTKKERMKHILYIRDEIYQHSFHLSESPIESTESETATNFLHYLRELKFLEHSNELLPINRFCDHTVKIFSMFPDEFIFLDKEYKDDDCWMHFFRSNNLQTIVSCNEFIRFCETVSSGNHKDMLSASLVLLEYLFSMKAENWYKDKTFLSTLKTISFIPVNRLEYLSWIKEPVQSRSCLPKLGINLTCFNEAASEEIAKLIWTVKPVITLPCKIPNKVRELLKDLEVFELLGLTTLQSLSLNDVYQNIVNISQTRLANFDLFYNYSIQTTYLDTVDVVDLIRNNLEYLYVPEDEAACLGFLEALKNIPCVPVYAAGHSSSQPVLVNSNQVVRFMDTMLLIPFINPLPKSFDAIGGPILKIMGVNDVITFRNIQFVLKFAYERFTDQMMNPNDLNMLSNCIIKLYELLLNRGEEIEIVESLSPLYLPSENSVLPVSSLLFLDCNRYKRLHDANRIDLTSTEYRFFHIPILSHPEHTFSEIDFCLKLPKGVQPKRFSIACVEKIANPENIITSSEENPLHQHFHGLKINLSTESTADEHSMPKVFEKILLKRYNDKWNETKIKKFMELFKQLVHELEVIQIRSLQVALFVGNSKLGSFPTKYILERKDTSSSYNLYIDSNASSFGEAIWKELANSFCIEIARISNTSFIPFNDTLVHFLKVRSKDDLQELLEEFLNTTVQLEWHKYEYDEVKLGLPISSKWHQSLANGFDTNIIFRTQEWVAYDSGQDIYVWAMILYPVSDEDDENTNPLSQKYKIIIRSDDEEGITVSVLDLYKILTKKRRETEAAEQRLVPTKDIQSTKEFRDSLYSQMLLELKKRIVNELREIWMLPTDDEKRKALRRMCYAYHPDKTEPKNVLVYEEAFKFLQSEIDHLENSPHWRQYYSDLNENIKKTKYSSQQPAADEHEDLDSKLPTTKSNLVEAKRWLRQAKSDYEALEVLNAAVVCGKPVYCQVLFMAHEVMEKGLKAAVYAIVGLSEYFLKIHDLTPLARVIHSEDKSTAQLITIASGMENYYLDTRFPNRFSCPTAPLDRFGYEEASRIADSAKQALDIIISIIINKEQA